MQDVRNSWDALSREFLKTWEGGLVVVVGLERLWVGHGKMFLRWHYYSSARLLLLLKEIVRQRHQAVWGVG